MSLTYELLASDHQARRGRITTPRGSIETPVFMPVGTRGAVIHLDQRDYSELEIEVVLGNTYHLMLRPGAETIDALGGIHAFTSWEGHMLTDSGGFQVMSLNDNVHVDDDGVTFASIYDGEKVRFTPEDAVLTQELLGADIQMALDVCPALPAAETDVIRAMERTHDWAARAKIAHQRNDQALFGIVQGGTDPALRSRSAKVLASLDFHGYGIGGLSVGETHAEMMPALLSAIAELPADRPRYLMGVGDPVRIVDAIGVGVDMFDCVLPTRLARHGTILTGEGKLNLKNAKHARDDQPLDPLNPMSNRFSRAYLRHLMQVKEPTAARIATLHNIWFLLDLVKQARTAIEEARYEAFRHQTMEIWA
ncbi:MAG: tRNA guanosine(34) transglycosylase Tgt [Actinomycetota bacterium]|nr:tRNA guanosine(34) transglycosylase Tgt [Acidimicrobiales bacterium]MED5551527.1 tRNA guanosine(34) transglycosylase Tgt [Actinomycetota bacterium]MEE2680362.1 tRNA guanosine(34) transglycosylase Tgt [Actinomycetota bacterium]MEE3187463.1 tRNA guanosine(34) transglycosylase Tgt [Actinomycetota bacterium]